jgi:hypothetical protein
MITKTASSHRTLMTISLAIPTLLAFGSVARADSMTPAPGYDGKLNPARPVATPVPDSRLNRFGCPACRSGMDNRFNDKVTNPVSKVDRVTPQKR